jgi:hypothetical protein
MSGATNRSYRSGAEPLSWNPVGMSLAMVSRPTTG